MYKRSQVIDRRHSTCVRAPPTDCGTRYVQAASGATSGSSLGLTYTATCKPTLSWSDSFALTARYGADRIETPF